MSELGSVTTCVDEQLCFRLGFANDSTVRKAPGRECVITVQTADGSAVGQSLMTITILNVIINVKCIYMWSLYGMYIHISCKSDLFIISVIYYYAHLLQLVRTTLH